MADLTPDTLQQVVLDAGLEIYRAEGPMIRIAERVRVHLMDSGVCVLLEDGIHVRFTVRSQRSDFPSGSPQQLFDKVRDRLHALASARGFREVDAATRDVTDPMDDANVLDVWHEITYGKPVEDQARLIEDIRWALELPKCVV